MERLKLFNIKTGEPMVPHPEKPVLIVTGARKGEFVILSEYTTPNEEYPDGVLKVNMSKSFGVNSWQSLFPFVIGAEFR